MCIFCGTARSVCRLALAGQAKLLFSFSGICTVLYCGMLGHKSEQNRHGTLPRIIPNFCLMTVRL